MLTPADLHSNSQQCACMKTPNRNRDSGRRLPCMSSQGRTTDGLTGQDHTRKAILARAAEPAAHLLQPAVRRLVSTSASCTRNAHVTAAQAHANAARPAWQCLGSLRMRWQQACSQAHGAGGPCTLAALQASLGSAAHHIHHMVGSPCEDHNVLHAQETCYGGMCACRCGLSNGSVQHVEHAKNPRESCNVTLEEHVVRASARGLHGADLLPCRPMIDMLHRAAQRALCFRCVNLGLLVADDMIEPTP